MVQLVKNSNVTPKRQVLSSFKVYFIEVYLLTIFYFKQLYYGTCLRFYIGFAFLLAFSCFQLGTELVHADARISVIALIRQSITVYTAPGWLWEEWDFI